MHFRAFPISFLALLWHAVPATACVDFAMSFNGIIGEFLLEAVLMDNGVQRCQLKGADLGGWPKAKTPIEMHCHEGYWAAIAFVNENNAVVRYARPGFDGVFTVQSGDYERTQYTTAQKWTPFANWMVVLDQLDDDTKPPGPFFRKTEWNCDYRKRTHFIDWDYWQKGYGDTPETMDWEAQRIQDRLMAKKGWNRSGPEDWKPFP